ncbi:MAG: hypothetical protein EOP06_04415 [Proteobacteria bacterium]|nr:MAG: hypothetical protein EOP06_04415 [Pseudomonadota bacterium]
MAKKISMNSIDYSESVGRWSDSENSDFAQKIEDLQTKISELEAKQALFQELTYNKREKKAMAFVKKTLYKPSRLLITISEVGDDMALAFGENLKPHRIKRVLDFYRKMVEKYELAITDAKTVAEAYPDLAECFGGLPTFDEVPVPHNPSTGEIRVVTLTGVKEFTMTFEV